MLQSPHNQDEKRATLIREITEVFDGVRREDGVTLHETEAIDDYASAAERGRSRAKDREKRWQDVPDEDLSTHDGFAFFDPKGFRYYLPAYLVWYVKYFDSCDSDTFPSVIHSLGGGSRESIGSYKQLFEVFTQAERRVIARFLEFEADRVDRETLARDNGWQEMSGTEGYSGAALNAYKSKITRGNDARRALERYWAQFLSARGWAGDWRRMK